MCDHNVLKGKESRKDNRPPQNREAELDPQKNEKEEAMEIDKTGISATVRLKLQYSNPPSRDKGCRSVQFDLQIFESAYH